MRELNSVTILRRRRYANLLTTPIPLHPTSDRKRRTVHPPGTSVTLYNLIKRNLHQLSTIYNERCISLFSKGEQAPSAMAAEELRVCVPVGVAPRSCCMHVMSPRVRLQLDNSCWGVTPRNRRWSSWRAYEVQTPLSTPSPSDPSEAAATNTVLRPLSMRCTLESPAAAR